MIKTFFIRSLFYGVSLDVKCENGLYFKINASHLTNNKSEVKKMSNPYLPKWEYIPDGEPRVFGNRVYIYGSHDRVNSEQFCDYKLKVWSAPVDDLNNWTCHGDCFHTRADRDHSCSTEWAHNALFAPDVVEKDGKYYLFAYIVGQPGCIAVSDRPEGPFTEIGRYDAAAQCEDLKANPEKYIANPDAGDEFLADGKPEEQGTQAEIAVRDMEYPIMIDPGVLVDDDGRVYVYCGYLHSYMFELDPDDMHTVIPGSYRKDFIPKTGWPEEACFFEACSPRKINGTYYLIYSPRRGSRLAYATSDSPTGPFTYRGYIIDNGVEYPAGNDHGSVCRIGDEWYIFYHRMTNGTIMSRRGAVERTELLADGSFKTVEMTSGGFERTMNPYMITEAETACVLKGGVHVVEKDIFNRPLAGICGGTVAGYKYFDFGEDFSGTGLKLFMELEGGGISGKVRILLDGEDASCEIGVGTIPQGNSVLTVELPPVTGIHAVYFVFETGRSGWMKGAFDGREICKLTRFVFAK